MVVTINHGRIPLSAQGRVGLGGGDRTSLWPSRSSQGSRGGGEEGTSVRWDYFRETTREQAGQRGSRAFERGESLGVYPGSALLSHMGLSDVLHLVAVSSSCTIGWGVRNLTLWKQ